MKSFLYIDDTKNFLQSIIQSFFIIVRIENIFIKNIPGADADDKVRRA